MRATPGERALASPCLQAAPEGAHHDVARRELATARCIQESQHTADIQLVDKVHVLVQGHLPVGLDGHVSDTLILQAWRDGRLGAGQGMPRAPVEAQDLADGDWVGDAHVGGRVVAHSSVHVIPQMPKGRGVHATDLTEVLHAREARWLCHPRHAGVGAALGARPAECRVHVREPEGGPARAGERPRGQLLQGINPDTVPRATPGDTLVVDQEVEHAGIPPRKVVGLVGR
mmetsp:Transcript_66947/g.189918  ORF Transcript_66947/g.189918 Transcript_66947/m.189918 type:complete len:230 (+) Transcript_66947:5146-5835(+)